MAIPGRDNAVLLGLFRSEIASMFRSCSRVECFASKVSIDPFFYHQVTAIPSVLETGNKRPR